MAGIKSQLVLKDSMSKPLKHINDILKQVNKSFENTQKISSNPVNTANIHHANTKLNETEDKLKHICNEADSMNKKFSATGSILKAMGINRIFHAAVNQIKNGINYASDLAEVQNVVDVSFGKSSENINKWAKTTLDAYGMNEVTAKRYSGTLGAMLKSSGIGGNTAVGMSMDLSGLAGDMASFHNLKLDTAFDKIRSGLSGETEPLKQLGIDMSVASMEAFAMARGIDKSFESMSQAEKVMLRYNYLMTVTQDVQGDFVRTQDSWANQTRLLSENWTEFTGILAEQALPALTQIVSWLNTGISILSDNADLVTGILLGLATTVGILSGAWLFNTAATWLAVSANRALIVTMLSNPLMWIALLIGVVVAATYKWIKSVGGITNAWAICKNSLLIIFTGIKGGFLLMIDELINGSVSMINYLISLINRIPGVNIPQIKYQSNFADNSIARMEELKQERTNLLSYSKAPEPQYNDTAEMISGISDNTLGINNNTGNIATSLSDTEEDLKYIKDIAEREVINRFTTAEIKIEQTNHNNISSDMDIEGVMDKWNSDFEEILETAAEGVH